MFRPISLWLTFHRGWRDPNETPAFPRWQWAMLLLSVGAEERGDLCFPRWVGLKKQTSTPARTSHPPTLTYTLNPWGLQPTFKEIFDIGNYWALGSDRSILGFQQAHREDAGWQLSRCSRLTELNACLLPPWGCFRWAPCLSLDVYTSLEFPCLITTLAFKERGRVGAEEKTISVDAWEKEEQAARKHFMSGGLWVKRWTETSDQLMQGRCEWYRGTGGAEGKNDKTAYGRNIRDTRKCRWSI